MRTKLYHPKEKVSLSLASKPKIHIPLSNPDLTNADCRSVLAVLKTHALSLGPKVAEFEEKFACYIGTRYAVAVNSGTSGLHLCVKALGLGEGDEALTSPFSFIASANCLLYERVRPHFIDIDPVSLNMNVEKMEDVLRKVARGKRRTIRAVLPVHTFGRPCDMDDILRLAARYGMGIIEDACEAIGAEYVRRTTDGRDRAVLSKRRSHHNRSRKVGTFGDLGVFAFYPNKQMTTGEGGMIVTDNPRHERLCRSLRNQGREENGRWLQHARLGYNYRLTDIQSALGLSQLARLEDMLAKREAVAGTYNRMLEGMEAVVTPAFEKNKRISWFVYVVRLTDRFTREDRDAVLKHLQAKGIGCSNYFSPIHLQPFYRKTFGFKKGDFPVTERAAATTIALPFYNNLREEQIAYVRDELKSILCSRKKR